MSITSTIPFKIVKLLGKGTSGKVYLGFIESSSFPATTTTTTTKNKNKVAIKIINKNVILLSNTIGDDYYNTRERIMDELLILSKVSTHSNIVTLRGFKETKDKMFLLMDYCNGGDLFDYVLSRGKLKENEALNLFSQLCDAVYFLHSKNICHHDIKLENCLLHLDDKSSTTTTTTTTLPRLLLSDFGLSVQLECTKIIKNEYCYNEEKNEDDKNKVDKNDIDDKNKVDKHIYDNIYEIYTKPISKFCGSTSYAAPELFIPSPYCGKKADIYSLGILLYVILTGVFPFTDDIDLHIRQQKSKVHLRNLYFDDVSTKLRCLILHMLQPCPSNRPTIIHVLQTIYGMIISRGK